MPGHLTLHERDRIAQLRFEGYSQQEVARAIGRCRSTVCRELHRNGSSDAYHAAEAQCRAQRRRSERPLVRKMDDPALNAAVRHGLGQEWSPEQIAGRLREQHAEKRVSSQTIYTWIDDDECSGHWKSFLRRRGKRRCRRKKPERSPSARIKNRPEVIEERMRFGDFEGDTILGPPGTGGLVTLVDRKSRYTIMFKIQSKNARHVQAKLRGRLKELDDEHRRSITFDNGTEFARSALLEKYFGLSVYYAEPGCPYQRGTNENTNGLIRQYYPKGTDFRDVSHHQVREAAKSLNNRPRACLGFRTPAEVFFEKSPPSGCD